MMHLAPILAAVALVLLDDDNNNNKDDEDDDDDDSISKKDRERYRSSRICVFRVPLHHDG